MATWNVTTKTTDENGKTKHLGQVVTQISDKGRAQELAERKHGKNVAVVRESYLVYNSQGNLRKKED